MGRINVGSKSGLKEFFGDGTDGTIPNLNTVTSAPNGGTVSNLWDMNAGTVFTTGTLSSASDQVVFSIDFGSPTNLGSTGYFAITLFDAIISTGVARNIVVERSDDNISWTQIGSANNVSTTNSGVFGIANGGYNGFSRYYRLVLKSGGSSCTFSCKACVLNYTATDGFTRVWRIIYPSTPNGAAVVKQYTDFNLPAGYEITVQNPCQGLVIYSQGDATVNGIIDMSQKAGLAPNGNIIPMIMSNFKVTDPYGVEMYNKLTTSLRNLKGGNGGNGGYGGGYSGSTGRQSSVGIGGAGRQNLGGFGGGGSGGNQNNNIGGVGGSITNAEIGGGKTYLFFQTAGNPAMAYGYNGSGGIGSAIPNAAATITSGICQGSGVGGTGAVTGNTSSANSSNNSNFSGGFIAVITKGNIAITGSILANGGVGGNGTSATGTGNGGGGGAGGGAGGGVIALYHKGTYNNSGTVQTNGGAGGVGGSGTGGGESGGSGTSGGVGTILEQQL